MLKPVWGFFLHFGYVETSRVAFLAVHHVEDGFDTLDEAVADLAKQFLDDYFASWAPTPHDASLDDFGAYLYALPEACASEGNVFLSSVLNDERWWCWASMRQLAPHLDRCFENDEAFDRILYRFIDPAWLPEGADSFRAELAQEHTPPPNASPANLVEWNLKGTAQHMFLPVLPPAPAPAEET